MVKEWIRQILLFMGIYYPPTSKLDIAEKLVEVEELLQKANNKNAVLFFTNLKKLLLALEKNSGNLFEFKIDRCAQPHEINQLELDLGRKLPRSFKIILLQVSKEVKIDWHCIFPGGKAFFLWWNDVVGYEGYLDWGLTASVRWEDQRFELVQEYLEDDEYSVDEIGIADKTVFQGLENAYLGFDRQGDTEAVYYFDGHFFDEDCRMMRIANNFEEFLASWGGIGFVGLTNALWEPFLAIDNNGNRSLSLDQKAAVELRAEIGLD